MVVSDCVSSAALGFSITTQGAVRAIIDTVFSPCLSADKGHHGRVHSGSQYKIQEITADSHVKIAYAGIPAVRLGFAYGIEPTVVKIIFIIDVPGCRI